MPSDHIHIKLATNTCSTLQRSLGLDTQIAGVTNVPDYRTAMPTVIGCLPRRASNLHVTIFLQVIIIVTTRMFFAVFFFSTIYTKTLP